MIDLIFVANSQRIVRSDVIPCSLSDHSLVFCVFKAGITKAPPRTIEYRSYKHYNKQCFLQDLKYVNWSTLVNVNDVDNSVNSWCKCFTDLADTRAPIKKTIPWMTAELSRAMQDHDYHLKKAKKHIHNIIMIGPVTVNFAALLIKKYLNANPNTTSL